MKNLDGLKIESLSIKDLENILIEINDEKLKNDGSEKKQEVLNKLFRFVDSVLQRLTQGRYIDFDENTCYCGHEDCDNFRNLKTEFEELVFELSQVTKERHFPDKRLIFVIDPEAYERDVEKDETVPGLFEILMKIFDVLICDARIIPCTDIEEMKFKIASSEEIPGFVLVDTKGINDLKKVIDLKQKYPETKFFVFSTDNSMAIAEGESDVTVIFTKRVSAENIFQGARVFEKK